MATQKCSTCNEVKDVEGFYVSRRNKSGFTSRCRSCCVAATTDYNLRHKERYLELKRESYHRLKSPSKTNVYNEDRSQKRCPRCTDWKPVKDFTRGAYCRTCAAAMTREWSLRNPEYKHAWRKSNPVASREANRRHREHLKRDMPEKLRERDRKSDLSKRGLTLDSYKEKADQQGGVCAICKGVCPSGRALAVDHDHQCCGKGKKSCIKCVRGLLCTPCNTLLHKLDSMPGWIEKAVQYLQQHPRLS